MLSHVFLELSKGCARKRAVMVVLPAPHPTGRASALPQEHIGREVPSLRTGVRGAPHGRVGGLHRQVGEGASSAGDLWEAVAHDMVPNGSRLTGF